MNNSDQNLIKNSILNTIDVIAATDISLWISWWLAKALFVNGLEMREERAREFIEYIINNPAEFTTKIMGTKEFQDGFVYSIEQYIRQRNKKKRVVAQKIFLSFAETKEKQDFELERYNQVLVNISSYWLEYLYFIKYTIIPLFEEDILNKAKETISTWAEGNIEFRKEVHKRDNAFSRYINQWIYSNFNPNSQKVKDADQRLEDSLHIEHRQILREQFEKERIEEKKYTWVIPEFISLWFFEINDHRMRSGWSEWIIEYNITEFWLTFLNFIEWLEVYS